MRTWLLAWILGAWPLAAAWAQQDAALLKAQVLVRLLRFVEWPVGAVVDGHDLQLCLTDDGPLAQQLMALDGQVFNTAHLRVRARTGKAIGGCHAVLVGATQVKETPGVLLIAEDTLRSENGPMVSLQVEDGRVVFDVDLDASRRAGVGYSARLLRLARFVRKAG